jgi:hypothetical protein
LANQKKIEKLDKPKFPHNRMNLLNELIKFILLTTTKHKIDDSHGISHSFNILHYTNHIYQDELTKHDYLIDQEKVIFISALVHDMCDKKYMDEKEGLKEITEFLSNTCHISPKETDTIKSIIETMSYSKVIKNGFPSLGEYQLAYHVVREADLLCAYDVDRCIMFHLYNKTEDIGMALETAENLFNNRVYKHNEHGLILLDYTKKMVTPLEAQCMARMGTWRNIAKSRLL